MTLIPENEQHEQEAENLLRQILDELMLIRAMMAEMTDAQLTIDDLREDN